MYARVSTYRGDADEFVRGFGSVTAPLQQMDGFAGAYVLVDRAGGRAMTVTLWESEQALRASDEQADRLREDATQRAGGSIESVDGYEVAMVLDEAPGQTTSTPGGEETVPPGA